MPPRSGPLPAYAGVMSTHQPEEDLPVLLPEVERQTLTTYVASLLEEMSVEEIHAAVDTLTEPGRAAGVVLERRRQAATARHLLTERIEESRRRDPEGTARAEEQVRQATQEIDARIIARRAGADRSSPYGSS
jgi:hypothetical protein